MWWNVTLAVSHSVQSDLGIRTNAGVKWERFRKILTHQQRIVIFSSFYVRKLFLIWPESTRNHQIICWWCLGSLHSGLAADVGRLGQTQVRIGIKNNEWDKWECPACVVRLQLSSFSQWPAVIAQRPLTSSLLTGHSWSQLRQSRRVHPHLIVCSDVCEPTWVHPVTAVTPTDRAQHLDGCLMWWNKKDKRRDELQLWSRVTSAKRQILLLLL